MSALALDGFTLEMRLHYIETTIEALERFKSYDHFFGEVNAVMTEWLSEAHSNEMNFFGNLLEILKVAIANGSFREKSDALKITNILSAYLNSLKSQEDSPSLYEKFHQSLQQVMGESVQLYLQCISHTHHFIVPVKNVIEIVSDKRVFPLPLVQKGVRGLMNFRGQGIPVVNLNDFGFKSSEDTKKEKKCFVVCDYKESFFALEVHSTEDVLQFDPADFQSCSDSSLLSPVVERFVIKENKSLMLLNIEKLVSYE